MSQKVIAVLPELSPGVVESAPKGPQLRMSAFVNRAFDQGLSTCRKW